MYKKFYLRFGYIPIPLRYNIVGLVFILFSFFVSFYFNEREAAELTTNIIISISIFYLTQGCMIYVIYISYANERTSRSNVVSNKVKLKSIQGFKRATTCCAGGKR